MRISVEYLPVVVRVLVGKEVEMVVGEVDVGQG